MLLSFRVPKRSSVVIARRLVFRDHFALEYSGIVNTSKALNVSRFEWLHSRTMHCDKPTLPQVWSVKVAPRFGQLFHVKGFTQSTPKNTKLGIVLVKALRKVHSTSDIINLSCFGVTKAIYSVSHLLSGWVVTKWLIYTFMLHLRAFACLASLAYTLAGRRRWNVLSSLVMGAKVVPRWHMCKC